MKISINWLSDYVDQLPPAAEVADRLTAAGLEVEDIERIGRSLDGVVVGQVLTVEQHPNADRLTVCTVDIGSNDALNIVCGAPNVAPGQRVPVATIGTTLELPPRAPGEGAQGLKIEKRKVRGQVSEGMICAEDELGLSDDHEGIMVLHEDASIGQQFAEYLDSRGVPLADAVLDVSITPNRPDATSHFGVARDIAALTGSTFVRPAVSLDVAGRRDAIDIEIAAPEACPRYVGVVVRGVTIGESPEWLKRRMTAVGLRPRNNVVDVTNYVMFECGQPLHAFDINELAGPAIRVRLSEGEESFITLDDQERKLPGGTLLICDAERPVAIAGVMGGANSEVTDRTTDILIESAYFDPSTVRRAAKALGLQTDSSYRFERGVDRDGQAWAAARAAELIVQIAGGQIEAAHDSHPVTPTRTIVHLRTTRVEKVLGVKIPVERMSADLMAIGFAVERDGDDLVCTVPSFRPDIEREIDVIEEVARLFGYDNIPEPSRTAIPNAAPRQRAVDLVEAALSQHLAAIGLHEVHTNSMLRRETAERFLVPPIIEDERWEVVETLNPISREMATLRPSLLPGILQVMSFNSNHGQRRLPFFEFGHVFGRSNAADTLVRGYDERNHLIIVCAGEAEPSRWNGDSRPFDIFDVKGIVEHVLETVGISDARYAPSGGTSNVTAYDAIIRAADGERLGVLAALSDGIRHGYDLPPVFFAELDVNRLLAHGTLDREYAPVSRFPVVERDIAIVAPKSVSAGDILRSIRDAGGALLRDAALFDLYEGDRIASDRRSLAYSLRFGAERTLTDLEIDERMEAIVKRLKEHHSAELRQ